MSNTRMYGGWRPRRGFGVGKLTEAQTAVTAACVFVPLGVWVVITTFGLSLLVMPVAVGIAVVVALLTLIPHRTHGTSLGGAAVIWMRTRTARRKGWTEWERVFSPATQGKTNCPACSRQSSRCPLRTDSGSRTGCCGIAGPGG